MIGPSSFLLETAPVLFSLVLLLAGLGMLLKRERRAGGVALCLAALVFGLLMGIRYRYQCQAHAWLENLREEQVRFVRVGPFVVSDGAMIQAITVALNNARWFSSNHGGWETMLPLEVECEKPSPVQVRVALYQRPEGGAILSFSRGGGWADGYAYLPELPAILQQAGAPLPGAEWVQVHPSGEWTAWYDPQGVVRTPAGLVAWVKLQKGDWTGVALVHLDCGAGRIRYEGVGVPAEWTQEFAIRDGSVSASLRDRLCGSP